MAGEQREEEPNGTVLSSFSPWPHKTCVLFTVALECELEPAPPSWANGCSQHSSSQLQGSSWGTDTDMEGSVCTTPCQGRAGAAPPHPLPLHLQTDTQTKAAGQTDTHRGKINSMDTCSSSTSHRVMVEWMTPARPWVNAGWRNEAVVHFNTWNMDLALSTGLTSIRNHPRSKWISKLHMNYLEEHMPCTNHISHYTHMYYTLDWLY